MNFWKICYRLSGWTTDISVPYRDKAVICVVPHTSNWDFIAGLFAYHSVGRKAGFLMKDFWFFFPLKYILRALGGIPVKRTTHTSMTTTIANDFNTFKRLNLAVTPEGTRKAVTIWKTGFLRIAYMANVPIQLGVIDYLNKKVLIKQEYFPSGDFDQDLSNIRNYYKQFADRARYPDKYIP